MFNYFIMTPLVRWKLCNENVIDEKHIGSGKELNINSKVESIYINCVF